MKILKWFRGILVVSFLVFSILFINLFQILSLLLLVFGKGPFVRFNIHCKTLFANIVALGARICQNKIIYSGDPMGQESGILMANHQSYLDIPILWMVTTQFGIAGWMNWFAKKSLQYVPGVGWGLTLAQAIFLKRNWSKDATTIKATFQTLIDAEVPFMVTIFPEGTRMKPTKFEQSRIYAQKRGLPIFHEVLTPRPKGVWASIQGLSRGLEVIYDVSVKYPTKPLCGPIEFFTTGGYKVKVHCKKYRRNDLPQTERDFNQWMFNCFAEKDKWMIAQS
jgi:lysocardiolipin and lysophospholipid acyltransferase